MRLRNRRLASGSFSFSKNTEVFEDLLGVVEIGDRLGCERSQLGVDGVAAGDVLGALQVAEFVEVAHAPQALFQGVAACRGLAGLWCGVV
ncbi:MAG: hypothetical protein ACRDLF_04180 [Solirubrobacteraceae bacterium]